MSAPLDSDLDSPADVLLPQTTYQPPPARDDAFPDPHDFYLQYHPFEDHQQHHQQQQSQHSLLSSPPRRLPDLSPSKNRRQLTVVPPAAPTFQSRQSSLQDLVNKFNQTPDEVVPKPASTAIHAHTRTNTAFYKGQPRPPSATAARRPLFGEIIPRHTSQTPTPTSFSQSQHHHQHHHLLSHNNPHSQFQTQTHHANLHPGPGTVPSWGRGRSGSDGCMHTPKQIHMLNNTGAFEPQPQTQNYLPRVTDAASSPAAWYLPTLAHQRSRSDLGSPVSPQLNMHPNPISTSFSSRQSQSQHPQSQSGQHSRIPLPSRRASQASDSGNSSPSTRTNSALDRYAPPGVPLPPKGISLLPKPSPTSPHFRARSSSTTTTASSIPSNTRRHIIRDQKSPTLQAFITAPLPKKSPPLRSSRPRQPVSSATTSASRARLVDRISGLQSRDSSSPNSTSRGSRSGSKKPPELGSVDFAVRRQRIQQAFNRTVEENAKKEEKAAVRREREIARKMARLQPQLQQEQPLPQPQLQPQPELFEEKSLQSRLKEPQVQIFEVPESAELSEPVEETAEPEITPTVIDEVPLTENEGLTAEDESLNEPARLEFVSEENNDSFVTPEEGRSPILLPLAYNPAQHGQKHESQPILEHAEPSIPEMTLHNYRPKSPESDNTDAVPQSAITVGTEITTFDPEPQEGIVTHRTMLNHIMQMRESSPSISSTSDGHDDHDTEHEDSNADDGESIHIMLRRSRYLGSLAYEVAGSQNRWSMSSWNSMFPERLPPKSQIETDADDTEPKDQEDSCDSSPSLHDNLTTPQPIFPPSPPCEADEGEDGLSAKTHSNVGDSNSDTNGDDAVIASLERRFSMNMANHYTTIARQARWDSNRATQLYLQELAKAGYERPRVPILTPGSSESEGKRLSSLDSESRDIGGEREKEKEREAEDGVLLPNSANIPTADFHPARASLHLRDDWETSPSIADWMHLAAEEDEMRQPQQNNQNQYRSEHLYQQHQRQATDVTEILHATSASASDQEGAETPKIEGQPQFASIDSTVEGLGLEIRVQSPQDGDSPTLPSPFHMHLCEPSPPPLMPPPPPPPAVASTEDQAVAFEMSPSVYTNSSPSSVVPALPTFHDAPLGSQSENSSLHITTPQTTSSSLSRTLEQPSSLAPETTSLFHEILEPVSRKSPTPEQRRLKKRRNVIKELVDTEYTFGQDMTVVVDIYKGTSSSCLGLSAEDVKTLFGNSEQVVQFSMNWQDALKQATKSIYVLPKSQRWSSKRSSKCTQNSTMLSTSPTDLQHVADEENDRKTTVGEAFMANIERMEVVYSDYLRNHDAANKTLEALLKNKNVNIWLKECREWAADLTSAWNLDSLLVKPVQRILKYPLLLTELLSATPSDHPDHAAISNALAATTAISVRINEMKKRADLVGQVVGNGRKRKESDVRAGLSKAFGRRTEKLKQHVGITEMFSDKDYDILSQRFGDNFFQLQLVMRDVEGYISEVQTYMTKFNEFIIAIEGYITLAPSNYPELESKWCRFRLAVKDVMAVALVEHVAHVRKSVVTPMVTLLKLHDGPQRVMQKRNKRLMDYVKYKAIKDRGDKPDKKITEQGEQFVALNMALKDELPKLLSLTGKLMEACLNTFIQIQATWLTLLQKRLGNTIDRLPQDINQIISDWSGDFSFSEAQVLSLGVCNGSILADTVLINNNYSSPPPSHGADTTSSRRPSTVNSATGRTFPGETGNSPKVSHDFGSRSPEHIIQASQGTGLMQHGNGSYVFPASDSRTRANSAYSVRAPDLTNGHIPSIPSIISPSTRSSFAGASNSSNPSFRASDASPKLPQLALDTPRLEFFPDHLMSSSRFNINVNGNSNVMAPDPAEHPSSPSAPRYSGFFSSAMPMPETPEPSRFVASEVQNSGNTGVSAVANVGGSGNTSYTSAPKEPSVLFLAASMFEFNIDRARREAGYPYLTYVAGEIFDVIGEKGDLWLARNQDDPTHQVGWIWTKHFAKLAG